MQRVEAGKSAWRRRARWLWLDWGWLLIFASAGLALLFGYVGYRSYFDAAGENASFWDLQYHAVQLFVLEFNARNTTAPVTLQIARLAAPVVVAVAAVRAIIAIFRDQMRRLAVSFMEDHVVVCGLGAPGTLLARDFKQDGRKVVAIEHDENASGVGRCREEDIPVLIGDATDPHMLGTANVKRAGHLIAVCGDDCTNAEVVAMVASLVEKRAGAPLKIHVHIVDQKLCTLLREYRRQVSGRHAVLDLHFFNTYEEAARAWIEDHPPFGDAGALDERAHLVVVGAGQMARSLVVGAARNWLAVHHVTGSPGAPEVRGARPVGDASGVRPRITLVGPNARREREWLLSEFPNFEESCGVIAREIDLESQRFACAGFLFDRFGRPDVSSVYVCIDEEPFGLRAALRLHDCIAKHEREGEALVQIVFRVTRYAELANLLRARPAAGHAVEGARFENLHAFEFLCRVCTRQQLLGDTPRERLARAIHEDFRGEQLAAGQTPEVKPSVAAWRVLRDDYKESNRRHADHAPVKLRSIGYCMRPAGAEGATTVSFSEDQIEAMAEMEHDRWVAERLFEGWRLGPADAARKVSPHLVPWDELSDEIKELDRRPVRALPGFLRQAGYSVHPIKNVD